MGMGKWIEINTQIIRYSKDFSFPPLSLLSSPALISINLLNSHPKYIISGLGGRRERENAFE